jgi:threonine 3-dehydrogenase
MKALSKLHPREGIWHVEAPTPEIGPEDVLIRVRRTAICGTDVHIYNWDAWASSVVRTPMIVGHEFSGEIVELGAAVRRKLKLGQRVSGEGHVINLDSAAARSGRFHLDPDTQGVGVNRQGAFADYLALPAFNVMPLPEEASLDVGAIMDPYGNAVHVAQQFDLLGQDVLVTGAGPIGIMAAAVARRAGARSVVLTDVNEYRLALAHELADVRTVNVAKEDLRDVMAQEGVEHGFAAALEMSGAPVALAQAMDVLKMGGNLAVLGLPAGPIETDWSKIVQKALTVRGVYGREMFATWDKMFGLLRAGLDLEPLITHRLPAARFQEGFEAMRSGQSGKVVLNWD